MKPCSPIHLLTLGAVWFATSALAQTTPTGTATSTTYPTGAVAPDSSHQSGKNRMKTKAARRNRRSGSGTSASNTSTGDASYRQSSSANGTAVNSSNTTNYNSNNATNAPTGAGSNPNATGTTTPPPGNDGGTSMQSGSTTPDGTAVTTSGATQTGANRTGTGTAVAVARTSETPAVVAGSTARNTSISDFVASSPNYVTLQNAIQAADLKDVLAGAGPYTLFAPSNSAFKKLPVALQNKLLEGQNRDALKQLLSYHVVAGTLDAASLANQIKAGGGKAQLTTLAGGTLTVREAGGHVTLTDEQGKTVTVDVPDQRQLNGVVHGISGVVLPKNGTSAFR